VILVARNANEARELPMVGSGRVCMWWEYGVRRSVLCWCFFFRNLASVAMMLFSHLIYFIKKCYKICSLNTICKNNVAVNCTTVQHKDVNSRQNRRVICNLSKLQSTRYSVIFLCIIQNNNNSLIISKPLQYTDLL
jgi:hypothetical protein